MNLEKLKDTARKFEQKEEWRKALDVYLKAIQQVESSKEVTPDISLYNRVGDLHMKTNDTTSAVRSYERAVDLYADQGFFNNAIALCGKILRVNPGRTEVYLKLAQLHARKNVVIEAKRNLLEYIERMNAVGQLEDAFAAVKRFADQFSGNPEIRMILVDLLRASSRADEAKEQLEKLEVVLEATGDEDNARKTRAALEEIERAPAGAPRRGDLIFLDTGPGTPPASTTDAPPAADPADFAMLDLEPGPAADASPAAAEPLAGLERSEVADGFSVDPAAAGDESFTLERSEPVDFSAAFDETRPVEGQGTIEPTSFEPLLDPGATVAPPDGLDLSAGLQLDTSALESEPADLDFGGMRLDALQEGMLERAEGPEDDVVEPIGLEDDLGADLVLSADAPEASAIDADSVELEFLSPDPGADLDSADAAIERESTLSFIEVGGTDAGVDDGIRASLEERVLDDPDDPQAHRDLGEQLAAEGDAERAAEELGIAVDRFEEREAWVDALTTVRRLVELAPGHIGTYQKWVELAYRSGERGPLVEAYLALGGVLVRAGAADKAIAVYQRVVEHDPGNAVAQRALEALTPPPAPPPAPPLVPPAPAPPKPPAKPAADATPAGDFVDFGSMVIEAEGPRDTRMRVERSDPKQDDEEREFREILAEFKRGIDQNLASDDYQAHYDLGIAFREMGLLDEAVAEFQKALRSPDGRLRTSEALGMAFFDKGQFAIAESVLRRAVDGLPGSDDEKIGLIYWLGRASEAQGKVTEALASYERTLAVDIRFHDAGERLNRLTAERRS